MPSPHGSSRRDRGLAPVVHAVVRQLEQAYNAGGGACVVVPALRPLLGGLPVGCLVVSRGPWIAQRSLLAALALGPPARRALGPVDARIDTRGDDAGDAASEVVSVAMTIDPHACRDLTRHAIARGARITALDLQHGRIENEMWARLAETTGALSEHPVTIVEGAPGVVELVWGDGLLGWRLYFTDAPDAVAGHADLIVEVVADEAGVALRVLDGRDDPPTVRRGRIVEGAVVTGPEDPDEACALDDQDRQAEERAAARDAERESFFVDDDPVGEPLWTPPPGDGDDR